MWPSSNNNPDIYSSGQWSFNATAYQNIPYEQVDWASLAQQWIRMKETVPAGSNPRPPPPPAPHISKPLTGSAVPVAVSVPSVATSHSQTTECVKVNDNVVSERPNYQTGRKEDDENDDIEGGEAPMDMDTKDEDGDDTVGGVASSGWGNWQNQWGWGWSAGNAGTVPLTESNPLTPPSSVDSKAYWREVGYSTAPEISPQSPPPTAAIIGQSWNKSNLVKDSNRLEPKQGTAESFVIDAAKKKKLPAWIREGLSKMDRDKQKKLDMERALQEKYIRDKIRAEELAKELRSSSSSSIYRPLSPLLMKSIEGSTNQPLTVPTIRYDSLEKHESSTSPETSSPPLSIATSAGSTTTTRPSSYHDLHSRALRDDMTSRPRLSQPTIRKTKDQIMEESMLKVRRILTQFLLEATEIQVQMIAKEEVSRFKSSASSRAVQKSKALTSLVTGNLGVNVYDSDSQSSGSEDSEPDAHLGDSDEELKNTIEKKMHEFRRIEDQIELEIELREADERSAATYQRQIDCSDNELSDNDDNVNNDINDRERGTSQTEKDHRILNSDSGIEEQQTNCGSIKGNVSSAINNTEKAKNSSKYFNKRKKSSSSSSSYSSSSSSSSSSDSSDNSNQKNRRKRKTMHTNNGNSSERDSKSKSKRYKPRSRSKSRSPRKDSLKNNSGGRKSAYERRRRSRSHDRKRQSRSRSSADSDADSQSSSNSRRRRTAHSPNRSRRRDNSDKSGSKSRDSNKSGNSYSYRRNESDSSRRRRRSRSPARESRRSRYK